jgi:hypothetical protein
MEGGCKSGGLVGRQGPNLDGHSPENPGEPGVPLPFRPVGGSKKVLDSRLDTHDSPASSMVP